MKACHKLLSLLLTLCCGCSPAPSLKPPAPPPPTPAATTAPSETFTNSVGMKLVRIPQGTFRMGREGYPLAHPEHDVTLSSFWIGSYEVTNQEYDRFKKRARFPESPSPTHPATRISWNDATAFCKWLGRKEGKRYRLPTEAEWEYAARGGLVEQDYPWGNEAPQGRATISQLDTTPVGTHAPNGYGLYDMAGNAAEWVTDLYAGEGPNGSCLYYANSPARDPQGPTQAPAAIPFRMIRGGCYDIWEVYCHTRMMDDPTSRNPEYGFRVVLDKE